MSKAFLRLCRRLVACASGVSAVEFALIAPVLLLLLAGTVDFARVHLLQTQMADLARETARRVATGRLSTASATAFASDQLATRTKADVSVTVTETSAPEGGQADVTVLLSIPLGKVMLFNFWMHEGDTSGGDPPMQLSASATMLKE